jgi:hypothetical protein
VNQILEDMLRACMMEHPDSWDKNLPWTKFSNNNNYQERIKMALFEVLYGRRYNTPVNWVEHGEKMIYGPDLVEEPKAIVNRIQDNLRAAKVMPRQLCKQEVLPLGICSWGSCVSEGFTHEGHK